MHGGVPSLSVTSTFTYRARNPWVLAGQYTGSFAGTDCCCASGTGRRAPAVVP
jgi:hypothetical protein